MSGVLIMPTTPAPAATPTGGEVDWYAEINASVKEAESTMIMGELDKEFVKQIDTAGMTVDGDVLSAIKANRVSSKFGSFIMAKLVPSLAEKLAVKMNTQCARYEQKITELNDKLNEKSSAKALSEDSLSDTELEFNLTQATKYNEAMTALLQAHNRHQSGLKSRIIAQKELEMLEYREQCEQQILQAKDDPAAKIKLRADMLAGGLTETLIVKGIIEVRKEIQEKIKRIEQHCKSTQRLSDAYRSALRTLGLSPEERDVALTQAIFAPSDKVFDEQNPDPRLGRTWMSDIKSILNQCPGRFWCIAPSICRMFNTQHYTGAGWRPSNLEQEYEHVHADLAEIYANQSKDMYNFLASKLESAVQTSTISSCDTPMSIGNRTHDDKSSWYSRAVEQDGVAVIEYWCHHSESKGREMRDKLRLFFEKTAQLEISSSSKLADAFAHIERQFAVVRSYGPPDNFRVRHSKALTKMAAALHGRCTNMGALCEKNKEAADMQSENYCFLAMQSFIKEASRILINLPSTERDAKPASNQMALYTSSRNDNSYPLFSGHEKGKGGGGGKPRHQDQKPKYGHEAKEKAGHINRNDKFQCVAVSSAGRRCSKKIQQKVQQKLSATKKQHTALCADCFQILRTKQQLLVVSRDENKAPWLRTWQSPGSANSKSGTENNDHRPTRAFMVQNFPAISEKSGGDGEADDDAESVQSAFSSITSADSLELASLRASATANAASRAAIDQTKIENEMLTKVLQKILPALGNIEQRAGSATQDNSQLLANISSLLSGNTE